MNRVQFNPSASADEKISQLADTLGRVADQGNINLTGSQQGAPSQISAFNVVESGGIHDLQIIDDSPAYAGLNYHVEYSQDNQNWHKIDLGTAQNHRANLGAGKYYWRASSAYHPATPSDYVYFGGAQAQSIGSGAYSGPPMQSQQSFTGQYRSSTTPPIRK